MEELTLRALVNVLMEALEGPDVDACARVERRHVDARPGPGYKYMRFQFSMFRMPVVVH